MVRAIYIEVVRPGFRRESENPILRCETIDVSVGGLVVRVPQPIPDHATLTIAAPMDDWTEELQLEGQAKWSKPAAEGDGYWVGLELNDSSAADMRRWFEVVKRLQD